MNRPSRCSFEELMQLGAMSRRRSDIVVFAGRGHGRLTDNVKYLYLHAATHDYGFTPYFYTTHKDVLRELGTLGLPAVTWNAEGVKMLAEAGMLVLDDLPHCLPKVCHLTAGAVRIQLWHGIPLKKIGFPEIESAVNMYPEKAMLLEADYSGADIVASTSPWVTRQLFSRVFRAKIFMEDGYPRNDVLLRQPEKHDLLGADAGLYRRLLRHRKSGGRLVVYMPTFRDTQLDFITEDGKFALDPPALTRYAKASDTLFVLKLHPYVNDAGLSELPGVLRYPSQGDIYPILPLADALITDYSSVYFDFLLLDRPVLFFPYDRKRYISRDREFFFHYEDMTPGPVAAVQGELLECLAAALLPGVDAWGEERRALRDLLFTHRDGGSAGRICRRIQAALRNVKDAAA